MVQITSDVSSTMVQTSLRYMNRSSQRVTDYNKTGKVQLGSGAQYSENSGINNSQQDRKYRVNIERNLLNYYSTIPLVSFKVFSFKHVLKFS